MSKHNSPTLRQQFNWWRINRLADRLHSGEAEPTMLKPHIHVATHEDGADVRTRQKQFLGAYVTTQISVIRSEADGRLLYVDATHTDEGIRGETHFRAAPTAVEEESFTANALCRVLRVAVAIPEQTAQPVAQE